MPNGGKPGAGGQRTYLRRQVTPIENFDGEQHIISGEVGGMMLTCHGVHFGAGNQRLHAQYRDDKAVLSGAPIVSPPPSEMPREYRKFCVATVAISYPEGDSGNPLYRWVVRFHVRGSRNAKAAIYSGIYPRGNYVFSRAANDEQTLEVSLTPPPSGQYLYVYLFFEVAPDVRLQMNEWLEIKKVEFLTT